MPIATLDLLDAGSDRRVKRTKKALRNALFELSESKEINEITVREITELADINRSTFYLYYKDVYDMFESIQNEILALFSKTILPFNYDASAPNSLAQYIERYLSFCKYNPELCKFIFRNGTNNKIAQLIKDAIVKYAPDSHNYFAPDDPRHHLTTFALYGITFTVIEWVESGMKTDVSDIAAFLAETYIHGSTAAKAMRFPSDGKKESPGT